MTLTPKPTLPSAKNTPSAFEFCFLIFGNIYLVYIHMSVVHGVCVCVCVCVCVGQVLSFHHLILVIELGWWAPLPAASASDFSQK